MPIKGKSIKRMKIKQHLNCKDYGIYDAICNKCNEIYTGTTINNFSKRRNTLRNIRKNDIINTNYELKDQYALVIHYKKIRKKDIRTKIKDAYKVQYLERLVRNNLDYKV